MLQTVSCMHECAEQKLPSKTIPLKALDCGHDVRRFSGYKVRTRWRSWL